MLLLPAPLLTGESCKSSTPWGASDVLGPPVEPVVRKLQLLRWTHGVNCMFAMAHILWDSASNIEFYGMFPLFPTSFGYKNHHSTSPLQSCAPIDWRWGWGVLVDITNTSSLEIQRLAVSPGGEPRPRRRCWNDGWLMRLWVRKVRWEGWSLDGGGWRVDAGS